MSYESVKYFLDKKEEACLMLYGSSGVGKTFLLQKILSEYQSCGNVKYVDCRSLLQRRRGSIEEHLLDLLPVLMSTNGGLSFSKQEKEKFYLLLDNVDDISGSIGHSSSLINCSVSSAVITLIDQIILLQRGKCVMTCTCAPSQLHERLLQSYRAGTSIHLDYPSFVTRQIVFLLALLESNCALIFDDDTTLPPDYGDKFDNPLKSNHVSPRQSPSLPSILSLTALSEMVARRTQGCTILEVANVIRDAMLYSSPGYVPVLASDAVIIMCDEIHSSVVTICRKLQNDGLDSDFFPATIDGSMHHIANSGASCLPLSIIARCLNLLSRPVVNTSFLSSSTSETGAGAVEGVVASVSNITFVNTHSGGAENSDSGSAALFGLEAIQQKLKQTVLGPYCNDTKEYFRRLGIRPCSGVVIQSPPGCGKTALSNWLVHEGRDHFKCISVSCAELVDKVVGASEQKLSNIFAVARMYAPCFLLLENIDCILGKGAADDVDGDGDNDTHVDVGVGDHVDTTVHSQPSTSRRSSQRTSHHALDRILSTMLIELDGIQKSGEQVASTSMEDFSEIDESTAGMGLGLGIDADARRRRGKDSSVVVVATTSDMSLLDRALLRPGRLEEHVFIQAPTAAVVSKHIFFDRFMAFACSTTIASFCTIISNDIWLLFSMCL